MGNDLQEQARFAHHNLEHFPDVEIFQSLVVFMPIHWNCRGTKLGFAACGDGEMHTEKWIRKSGAG